jgi:hypothetical protein
MMLIAKKESGKWRKRKMASTFNTSGSILIFISYFFSHFPQIYNPSLRSHLTPRPVYDRPFLPSLIQPFLP